MQSPRESDFCAVFASTGVRRKGRRERRGKGKNLFSGLGRVSSFLLSLCRKEFSLKMTHNDKDKSKLVFAQIWRIFFGYAHEMLGFFSNDYLSQVELHNEDHTCSVKNCKPLCTARNVLANAIELASFSCIAKVERNTFSPCTCTYTAYITLRIQPLSGRDAINAE